MDHSLEKVAWSPDGKMLLFGTCDGYLKLYDQNGYFLQDVKLYFETTNLKIVSLEWFNNFHIYSGHLLTSSYATQYDTMMPTIMIAYNNGLIQLMRHENDPTPIVFNSNVKITSAKWCPNGQMFAVSGGMTKSDEGVVMFYNWAGELIRTLKMASGLVNSLTWEGNGLRIAMAVQSQLFFANVKPEYRWT